MRCQASLDSRALRLAVCVALAVVGTACPAAPRPHREATAAATVITGQVSYRERIALMPDAELRVRLLDVLASVPTVVVSERTIHPSGNVPISFELPVPASIDPTHTYVVDARLISGGREWHTIEQHPVLTLGAPTTVHIVLH